MIGVLSLLLLLGVGTAWAGDIRPGVQYEYHPPYLVMTQAELDKMQADTKLEYGADAYIRVMILDPPCLTQMEQAMRAYNKFVNYGLMPPPQEDMRERINAIKLWDDTIRECWTK